MITPLAKLLSSFSFWGHWLPYIRQLVCRREHFNIKLSDFYSLLLIIILNICTGFFRLWRDFGMKIKFWWQRIKYNIYGAEDNVLGLS